MKKTFISYIMLFALPAMHSYVAASERFDTHGIAGINTVSLEVLSFKNLDYSVRLPYTSRLYVEDDAQRFCHEANNDLFTCVEPLGKNAGQKTYTLYSSIEDDPNPGKYDRMMYEALLLLGSKQQVTEFHAYINRLANYSFTEKSVSINADVVEEISKTAANEELKSTLDFIGALGLVNEDPLINFYYSDPNLYSVFNSLVSIHKCDASNGEEIMTNIIPGRIVYWLRHTSPGFSYLFGLDNSETICD